MLASESVQSPTMPGTLMEFNESSVNETFVQWLRRYALSWICNMDWATRATADGVKLDIASFANSVGGRGERLAGLHAREEAVPVPLVRTTRDESRPSVDFGFRGTNHVHAVDGGRPSQDFPAWPGNSTAVGTGLCGGGKSPVVSGAEERLVVSVRGGVCGRRITISKLITKKIGEGKTH